MQPQKPSRVIGIFETQEQAAKAIQALLEAKFPAKDIVVVARDWKGPALSELRVDIQQAGSDGTLAGTLLGGGAGVLAGLLAALIPGIGLGVLVLVGLAGATGAAAGAFVGPFIAMEMTEAEAREHATQVEQGKTIIVVRTADRQAEARAAMVEKGAYDFSMSAK